MDLAGLDQIGTEKMKRGGDFREREKKKERKKERKRKNLVECYLGFSKPEYILFFRTKSHFCVF